MTAFDIIADHVGSQRIARDLIAELEAQGYEVKRQPWLVLSPQSPTDFFPLRYVEFVNQPAIKSNVSVYYSG